MPIPTETEQVAALNARAVALERAIDVVRTCVPPAALQDKAAAGEIVLDLADKFAGFILLGDRRREAASER